MGSEKPDESESENERPSDAGDVFPTHGRTRRRTFLRAAGAGALATTALLAGCNTTQTRRYEALPVSLSSQAEENGYVLSDESTSEVSRTEEAGGVTLEITLISHLASYDREGTGFVQTPTVGLASTPAASEAGVNLNPVTQRSTRDLLTGEVGRAFLRQVDIDPNWQRGPEEIARSDQNPPGSLLGNDVQFKTFAGITEENEFALLHVARTEDGDDEVLVGDARTKPVENTDRPFVGENGYITREVAAESAEMFVELLPWVVHGEDTGPTPTPTQAEEFPKTTQGSVARINTEEVPEPPDEFDREGPPEGFPVPEEEFEELKEQAARGELPQPPRDELQTDEEPQRSFSGAANLNKARTQSRISVGTGFDGWESSALMNPSDANIAVGRDKAVLAANVRWGIYDKSSGNRQFQVALDDWFSPVIDPDDTFVFDPKALYDHHQDRYILMAVGRKSSSEGSWLVAVSDDDNPFGTWWLTRIPHNDGWVDYPELGVDQNGIYLTGNIFEGGFKYSRLVIVDKTPLYNGNSFTYWWYNKLKNPDGSDAFTVQPTLGMTPSGTQYLVNSKFNNGNSLTLWELRNPTSSPRLSKQSVSVSSYSLPPDAEQPNTSATLETVDARLMNAVYENGSVWTAHSISYDWDDDGDASAILKYYEIDVNNKSVAQSRGWGRPGADYFFPTIASNAETSTMIVYNESGPNVNPRIEVVGRTKGFRKSDFEDVALIKRGESAYRFNRWGDYNGIVVDPTNLHYWTSSQYGFDSSNTSEFETWVGEAFF